MTDATCEQVVGGIVQAAAVGARDQACATSPFPDESPRPTSAPVAVTAQGDQPPAPPIAAPAPADPLGAARAAAVSGPGTWEVYGVEADARDPYLNLRASASLAAAIVAKLPSGTPVQVLGSTRHFRQVRVMGGEHAGKEGHGYVCCLRPIGALDIYRTRLGPVDHENNQFVPLSSPAAIVRQDRANYHEHTENRDQDDAKDRQFSSQDRRAWLEEQLRKPGALDASTAETIRHRTPLVEVVVWPDRVTLEVLERGESI